VTSDQLPVIRKKEKKVISLPYEVRRTKWGEQVISNQKGASGKGQNKVISHQ
jgi:hypothetical protein